MDLFRPAGSIDNAKSFTICLGQNTEPLRNGLMILSASAANCIAGFAVALAQTL